MTPNVPPTDLGEVLHTSAGAEMDVHEIALQVIGTKLFEQIIRNTYPTD